MVPFRRLNMGVPRRLIEVLRPQGFPPVMVAYHRQPFSQSYCDEVRRGVPPAYRKRHHHHDPGPLGSEHTAQVFHRLVHSLGRGAAHIGGNAVLPPDLHGDKAAVGLAAAQKQHIDGVFRLSQNAVSLDIPCSFLHRIVFGTENRGKCLQQHQQNQQKCRR